MPPVFIAMNADDTSSEAELPSRDLNPEPDIFQPPMIYSIDWIDFPWCYFPIKYGGADTPAGWSVLEYADEGIQFWAPVNFKYHEFKGWWWTEWQLWTLLQNKSCTKRFYKSTHVWWWETSHDYAEAGVVVDRIPIISRLPNYQPKSVGRLAIEGETRASSPDNPHWEDLQ